MASTYTPNIQLNEPARGDLVGTWDAPVNSNMTLLDLVAGGGATISLNNSNVVLSAAQFQAKTITFNSTLTGSVSITFPSSFTKSYEIQNLCTGSSAFVVILTGLSSISGAFIACPPGEIVDVVNDGINIKFKNLGRVGSYMEYAGSSVPNWISNCGINNSGYVPPYLNCDGSTFSATTYPALAAMLGGTTLPDSRGRLRLNLNQGTGRTTTGGAGVDGNTFLAAGGANGVSLAASQIPAGVSATNASNAISVTTTQKVVNGPNQGSAAAGGTQVTAADPGSAGALSLVTATGNNAISVVTVNGGQTTVPTATPTYVGGITLIRAA